MHVWYMAGRLAWRSAESHEAEVDSEGRMRGRRKMKSGDEEWETRHG